MGEGGSERWLLLLLLLLQHCAPAIAILHTLGTGNVEKPMPFLYVCAEGLWGGRSHVPSITCLT